MKHFFAFTALLLLFSCSVQKRKYQKGFYVNRINHKTEKIKVNAAESVVKTDRPEQPVLVNSGYEPVVEASAAEGSISAQAKHSSFLTAAEDSCDVLFFKDGSEIKSKVLEITPNEVKYKRCDNQDGPSYVARKSDLFMIKYSNGTREVIKAEEQVKKPAPTSSSNQTYIAKKPKRMVHPLAGLSLGLGIISVAFPFFELFALGAGLTLPPIFLGLMVLAALLAVIIGKHTLNQIRNDPDIYRGKGMAMPGFIMGLVMLGIYLTTFLIILLIIL